MTSELLELLADLFSAVAAIFGFAAAIIGLRGIVSKPAAGVSESTPQQPSRSVISSTVMLVSGAALVIASIIIILYTPPELDIPLQNSQKYTFEDENSRADWEIVPTERVNPPHRYALSVSSDQSHSGTSSLMLWVDLEENTGQPQDLQEYGGIRSRNLDVADVRLIVAWVLVPKDTQVQLRAHLLTYGSSIVTGESFGFFGLTEFLNPGEWTPIFLGSFEHVDGEEASEIWNGVVNEIFLSVWTNDEQGYTGPIYIDDIELYTKS